MQFQKKKFSETRSEFWRLPNANTRAEEREKSGGLYVDKYWFPSLFLGLRNLTFYALTGFTSFFAVFPYFLVHKYQNLGYQELSVCIYLFPRGKGDTTHFEKSVLTPPNFYGNFFLLLLHTYEDKKVHNKKAEIIYV